MNLLPMYYFTVVVEKKNISAAAKQLHITQQTLSAHIAQIEKELQCVLFQRKPRFVLTYAGSVFYQYACQFHDLYDSMQKEFKDLVQQSSGKLNVGVSHTRSRVLMPQIISGYQEKYPQVQIHLWEQTNDALVQMLQEETVDFVFANLVEKQSGLNCIMLYEEEMLFVVPKKLWEPQTNWKNLKIPRELPFLLNKPSDIAGRLGNILLQKKGIMPRVTALSDNMETILMLCMNGSGACFCPNILFERTMSEDQKQTVTAISTGERYPIYILWKNKSYVPELIRNFIQHCKETIGNI